LKKRSKKLFPLGPQACCKLGIVVGLKAEARLVSHLGRTEIGGGEPAGAAKAARRLLEQGADTLLSFGLAGGLDPALPPGHLVIPRAVLCGGIRYETQPQETGPTIDLLLGGTAILATVAEKRAAWLSTGAAAVDLESGAVARIAAEAGVQLRVIRAICDPAERALPPAARLALDPSGRIGLLRVARSVATQPSQIPSLLRLARDARRARSTLLSAIELELQR